MAGHPVWGRAARGRPARSSRTPSFHAQPGRHVSQLVARRRLSQPCLPRDRASALSDWRLPSRFPCPDVAALPPTRRRTLRPTLFVCPAPVPPPRARTIPSSSPGPPLPLSQACLCPRPSLALGRPGPVQHRPSPLRQAHASPRLASRARHRLGRDQHRRPRLASKGAAALAPKPASARLNFPALSRGASAARPLALGTASPPSSLAASKGLAPSSSRVALGRVVTRPLYSPLAPSPAHAPPGPSLSPSAEPARFPILRPPARTSSSPAATSAPAGFLGG